VEVIRHCLRNRTLGERHSLEIKPRLHSAYVLIRKYCTSHVKFSRQLLIPSLTNSKMLHSSYPYFSLYTRDRIAIIRKADNHIFSSMDSLSEERKFSSEPLNFFLKKVNLSVTRLCRIANFLKLNDDSVQPFGSTLLHYNYLVLWHSMIMFVSYEVIFYFTHLQQAATMAMADRLALTIVCCTSSYTLSHI
jgi:hypothetical protein